MASKPTIVWFRRDLRLEDNPAWNWAVKQGGPIIPLYIHAPQQEGVWQRGGASNWWLHHALKDLDAQLQEQGSHLIIRASKNPLETLLKLIDTHEVENISWNRCYEPSQVKHDTKTKKSLQDLGIETHSANGALLLDPHSIRNKSGKPFQVFTPFWKHCRALELSKPESLAGKSFASNVDSDSLDSLELLPTIPWDKTMSSFWEPTRKGALSLLKEAIQKSSHYETLRDIPSTDGTSRLSPYLHFGQISPQEFFHTVREHCPDREKADTGILRQLYWREFAAHLLYHFQHSQDLALKPEYDRFPWDFNEDYLRAWQRGQTGFPIVDAGMRQLWQTGWMHNRVRMIAGSLLVKHLLQPWQEGARWFWDTLVDADLGNNSMGWQWVAGSGADASPYFRIFNPIIQGKKFDPTGEYVKKWVPELSELSKDQIHTPWEVTPIELASAGVTLGKDYPHPIISHEDGRQAALDAYASYKQQASDK